MDELITASEGRNCWRQWSIRVTLLISLLIVIILIEILLNETELLLLTAFSSPHVAQNRYTLATL